MFACRQSGCFDVRPRPKLQHYTRCRTLRALQRSSCTFTFGYEHKQQECRGDGFSTFSATPRLAHTNMTRPEAPRSDALLQPKQLRHLGSQLTAWDIWFLFGSYMVLIWFLYGSYMVLIYGPYMVLIWFLYGSQMVLMNSDGTPLSWMLAWHDTLRVMNGCTSNSQTALCELSPLHGEKRMKKLCVVL